MKPLKKIMNALSKDNIEARVVKGTAKCDWTGQSVNKDTGIVLACSKDKPIGAVEFPREFYLHLAKGPVPAMIGALRDVKRYQTLFQEDTVEMIRGTGAEMEAFMATTMLEQLNEQAGPNERAWTLASGFAQCLCWAHGILSGAENFSGALDEALSKTNQKRKTKTASK